MRPDALVQITLIGRLVGLMASIFVGMIGNAWYLKHARQIIAEVRSQGLPDDSHAMELARRGGTNLVIAISFFLLFLVGFVAVEILMEIF